MKKITNLSAVILVACLTFIILSCNKDDVWYTGQCTLTGQIYYIHSGVTDTVYGNSGSYITKGNTTCPENPTTEYDQFANRVDGAYHYYQLSKGDYYIYVEYTDSLGTKYTGGEHVEVTEEDVTLTKDITLQ